jgi:hypothetical protein
MTVCSVMEQQSQELDKLHEVMANYTSEVFGESDEYVESNRMDLPPRHEQFKGSPRLHVLTSAINSPDTLMRGYMPLQSPVSQDATTMSNNRYLSESAVKRHNVL